MLLKIRDFFSTRVGKEKIQAGRLSQTELFIYFYLLFLFDNISLAMQAIDLIGKAPRSMDYLNIWLNPIMGLFGLVLLFLANGGSKGHNFLSKYFTFSFTVGIKYYVIYIFLEYLPAYFSVLSSNFYEVTVAILLNITMLANIALRIYQTKTQQFSKAAR